MAQNFGLTPDEVYALLNKKIKEAIAGGTVDLSDYYTKDQVDTMFQEMIERVDMTSGDTLVSLEPNKLYVFPEMAELTINFPQTRVITYREYHFIFESGETPTVLTLPENVKSDLAVESNRIYEVSIIDNLLAWTSWEA